MAQTGKKWYVLRAVSGKEAKVKEYIEAELKHNELLSKYVSQVVIPMEKHAALRGQKRVVKEKIALPGYVLVEAELKGDVAHTLRFMPNVLGFLGGLDNPSPVREAEVHRMLGIAEDTEIQEEIDDSLVPVALAFHGVGGFEFQEIRERVVVVRVEVA